MKPGQLPDFLEKMKIKTQDIPQAMLPEHFFYEKLETLKIGECAEIYPSALHVDTELKCSISPNAAIFRDVSPIEKLQGYLRVDRDENGYHVSIPSDINFRWNKPQYDKFEEIEFNIMMGEPDPIPVVSVIIIEKDNTIRNEQDPPKDITMAPHRS